MKKSLFLSIAIFVSLVSFGQSAFTPEKLDANVNTEYNDINPVIAPNGTTLYFNRVNHPENTFGLDESMDIWYSEYNVDSNTWSPAKRMPFPLNTARSNAIVSVSEDGNSFVIKGIFSKKRVVWIKRGLSTVEKLGDTAFAKPVKMKIPAYSKKNKGAFSNSFVSTDGNTALLSYTKKWNKHVLDLFIARKKENGKWGKPKKLKDINDYGSIEAPFLSADNKFLYFSANRFKGEEFDIMRVSRIDDTYRSWTSPVVLSDTINSIAFDSYYKTNIKGSWAYYCSDKNGNTKEDIYRVKLFEENPFVVLSGQVINAKKKEALESKYTFTVMADGKAVDSVTIDSENAKFKFKLPLGAKYYLKATVPNFNSKTEILDVANVIEYLEMEQNLYVTPIPYILVKGKLLDKKTNLKLSAATLPRVALDGVITDSVTIDIANGTYQIKVPYGSNHSLQVLADKYTPNVENLNLNDVDGYKVMNVDLYATEIQQVASLSGKIINKKDNKPLPADVDVQIKVNDVIYTNATINRTTGEYFMELPLGQVFVINASANKYFPDQETINLTNETVKVKVLKDLFLAPLEVGASVKLNNVFFETGKAALKEESYIELDKVVNFLNDYTDIKIEIGGHTDNVGRAESNLKLSDERAASVAGYLRSKGIDATRITSKGYGMEKPVVANDTEENKAKNRRVEFTILGM